jgi:hypothetical protein
VVVHCDVKATNVLIGREEATIKFRKDITELEDKSNFYVILCYIMYI